VLARFGNDKAHVGVHAARDQDANGFDLGHRQQLVEAPRVDNAVLSGKARGVGFVGIGDRYQARLHQAGKCRGIGRPNGPAADQAEAERAATN
jgi:hypothetical protein